MPLDDANAPIRYRNVAPELVERARELRKDMTPAEHVLWNSLRGGGLNGLRFRKQHPFQCYIFDFCCPSHKLIVEVDGGLHDTAEAIEHDQLRDEYMRSRGYRTLRFRNAEVLNDIAGVLDRIEQAANVDPRTDR